MVFEMIATREGFLAVRAHVFAFSLVDQLMTNQLELGRKGLVTVWRLTSANIVAILNAFSTQHRTSDEHLFYHTPYRTVLFYHNFGCSSHDRAR